MTDTDAPTLAEITGFRFERPAAETATNRFVEQALRDEKREGLVLAVRARWIALAVIAVLIAFVNPRIEVLYYEALLGLFALIGWLQLRYGRVGQSGVELFLLFCDLALLTVSAIVPNPFSEDNFPLAMQYQFDTFIFFFVLLASATLSFNWRTLMAMGNWTAILWLMGLAWVWWNSPTYPELSEAILAATGGNERLAEFLDPNNPHIMARIQEATVFMIVAFTLALGSWRAKRLLTRHAAVERERSNLARYFSPNVVEELSNKDEPLKSIRTQNAAVLFVDIVGFTSFAETREPADVIETLRGFHGQMEREVFRHDGTLDKYLGDGLMATFGTPFTTPGDAANALRCAMAMIDSMTAWNKERAKQGEPPIQASFGLHYGDVVLGDIGASRLEFAVIGDTVNVASRLETMTRGLGVQLVASDAAVRAAREQADDDAEAAPIGALKPLKSQPVRGVAEPVDVWTL